MITIILNEFGNLFRLNGVLGSSTIYEQDAIHYALGEFTLHLNVKGKEYSTLAAKFPRGKVRVNKRNDEYYLERTDLYYSFNFPSPIAISKNMKSAVLYVGRIVLYKSSSLEVSFDKIELSIIGPLTHFDLTNPNFHFSSNYDPNLLVKVPSSGPSGRSGFFLETRNGDPCVIMGSPSVISVLDHFEKLTFRIQRRTEFSFNLNSFVLDIESKKKSYHNILFHEQSEWELDNRSLGASTFLNFKKIRCEDGEIRSMEFHDSTTTISKKHPDTSIKHKGLRTKIYTSTNKKSDGFSKLSFHFPMELNGSAKKKASLEHHGRSFDFVPQFIYRDDLTKDITLENQHYGLRIRGVNNEKGASVKLDTNIAVLAFDQDSKDMELRAGGEIDVLKQKMESYVVPKKNILESFTRKVTIPSAPSYLIVEEQLGKTNFVIDTKNNKVFISNCTLELSPFTSGNFSSNQSNQYDKSRWIPEQDLYTIKFDLLDDGIKANSNWLSPFRISPETRNFKLLDTQESEVKYDSQDKKSNSATSIIYTKIDTEEIDEKEKLIYQAFASTLVLGYVGAGMICGTFNTEKIKAKCLPRNNKEYVGINFDLEKDPSFKDSLINRNVNELLIAFYGIRDYGRIKKFVDDNIQIKDPSGKTEVTYGFWPIIGPIGIPLVRKKRGEETKYCYQLLKENYQNDYPDIEISTGLGIDLNKIGSIDYTSNFGFNKDSFEELASNPRTKLLFPTYNSAVNGRIDPTSPSFIGIVFRNMPLMLKVKLEVEKISEFLLTFLDEVNKNLFLEFGWKDPKGMTWLARLPKEITNHPNYKGIKILDNSIIKLYISEIYCLGIEGKLRDFSLRISLGLIEQGENNYKFVFDADARLVLSESGIDDFTITPRVKPDMKNVFKIKDSVPGFDYIRFHRFDTNFKRLFAYIDLYPSEELVEVLPIFTKYTPKDDDPSDIPRHVLRTVMAFDTEAKSAVLSLVFDGAVETKVFGKWPLSIRAVNIIIGGSGAGRLEVVGDFNFGLENFVKIGGRIILSMKSDGKWDFDIHLDQIGGSVAISDEIKIAGYLAWGDAFPDSSYNPKNPPPNIALDRDKLVAEGKDRDFYGVLFLQSPGIFGDSNEIFVKIASSNGIPYWVSGLRTGGEINLGFGKLRDPELVLAKNSDYKGQIDSIVTNVDTGLKALRNKDFSTRLEWLKNWKYSDKTGFTLIASGYLVYELLEAGSLQVTTPPDNEKFTGLLYSSEGIIRIEGWIKMLEDMDDVQILFTIDLRKKRILVGFQLPTFYFPSKNAAERWTFRPGLILLGTSFGGPQYLLASFGWPPEKRGGSSYERDWSKATQVSYQPPKWPLPNVFSGGFKFELDHKAGFILFAIAVRAGWSWEVSFGIGKAGLSVFIGGVLLVRYDFRNSKMQPLRIPVSDLLDGSFRIPINTYDLNNTLSLSKQSFDRIQSLRNTIANNMESAMASKLSIQGEIFAKVKGYAYVKIFGIKVAGIDVSAFARLRVCGDTDNGITFMGGSYGARACVKIGCSTKCKGFTIDIVVISGPCASKKMNYKYLPQLTA